MGSEAPFLEVDYSQRCKDGEVICGDAFYSLKIPEQNRVIAVLSDGLGSGVKANILSSMTAKMALKFVASNVEFLHSAEIMMEALPVCQVRKISYATFTIVDSSLRGLTKIIQMGNPPFLLIRGGRAIDVATRDVSSPRWKDRTMLLSEIYIRPGDRLIFFSDGISQAGIGTRRYPLGWSSEGCRDYVLERIQSEPNISARQLSRDILTAALMIESRRKSGDDMTCAVMYFRKPRKLLMLTGPPYQKKRDAEYAGLLQKFDGRKVVCGGTTAEIVARELRLQVKTSLENSSPNLPPVSTINGIDLVTEGILTLTRVEQLLDKGGNVAVGRRSNAAVRLVDLLLESDIIHMVVGAGINEAHLDPSLPTEIDIRRNIVKRIAHVLEERYLKEVFLKFV